MKPQLRYRIRLSKGYRKDVKRLSKMQVDLSRLENVIDQLTHGERLQDAYRDHALKGALQGTRECHIGPDWLLRYAKDDEYLFLLLMSTGDHRHVLGIE